MGEILHYIDMNLSKDKCWLVKVNGRILGPHSKGEIFELLKNKEIVVLNEVMPPFRRWQYIRDLDEFADIVEELRVLEFGSNEDLTMTTSQTASVTEKLDSSMVDDRTQDVPIGIPREIVIENVVETPTGRGVRPSQVRTQYKADFKNVELKKETAKATRSIWIGAFGIILAVSGYVLFKKMEPVKKEKTYSSQEYTKMALNHYYAGDYEKALPLLHTAQRMDPENEKINSLIAPLMVFLEPEKKNELESILEKLNKSEKISKERALTLEGLLDIKEKNYRSAKRFFTDALKKNPFFWQAFANLGVISFLEGDYLSAKNHFESALSVEVPNRTSRGEVYLMRAASEIYLWKEQNARRYLDNAKSGLESYISEFSDYKQEAYLLKSFVDYALNDKEQANHSINEMVNTDPMLTMEHAKDPMVDRSPISWKQLLPWCEALVSGMGSTGIVSAMYSLCLVQNGENDIDAKVEISKAMSQSPTDPLVNSVFAYITWVLGEDSKAEMLVTKAIDLNRSSLRSLPHVIKARICETAENFECAIEHWQVVRTLEAQSVSAYGGLAYAYLKTKQFTLFEAAFTQGTKYSRYYKPLLRSEVLAGEEGLNVRRD